MLQLLFLNIYMSTFINNSCRIIYCLFRSPGTGDDEESRSWMGFVESRIGRLPQFLESLPLKHPIHFYPVPSKTQESANSICYFIGFDIDQKLAARGDKNIHIDHCAYNFS